MGNTSNHVTSPLSEATERYSESTSGGLEAQKEEWAAALARRVESEFLTLPARASAPAHPEQGSDGLLTSIRGQIDARPLAPRSLASNGVKGGTPPAPITRVMGELDGGHLGTVRFAVMRTNAGLNVVLGVGDAQQRALSELEKTTLLRSLEQSGLKVASVMVTTPEAAGAAFAQHKKEAKTAHGEKPAHVYRQQNQKPKPSKTSELELIG